MGATQEHTPAPGQLQIFEAYLHWVLLSRVRDWNEPTGLCAVFPELCVTLDPRYSCTQNDLGFRREPDSCACRKVLGFLLPSIDMLDLNAEVLKDACFRH